MTLYIKNNGYPSNLPFRIVLPNGFTRTDPSTFTPEELVEWGYEAVDDMPSVSSTQIVTWNYETKTWNVRDKSEEEIEAEQQQFLNSRPLTARQLRLGLVRNNFDLSIIDSTIESIVDVQERNEAKVYWEYSTNIAWNHPITQLLMQMVGLTQEQAKTMWLQALNYET